MAYKGIAYACFAPGTYVDGQAPTYTGGKIFTKLCSANVTFTRSNSKLYADNGVHLTDNGITGGDVSLDVSSMDDDAQVDVLGYVKDSTSGEVEETDDESPIGGFGYVITEEDDNGTDKYIAMLIYKTQLGMDGQDISTRGESTEYQTPKLTGPIMGIVNDSTGKKKYRKHKTCDTEAAALTWVKNKLSIT